MVWIYESDGPLRGESHVIVTNKRTGWTGNIAIQYFPVVQFVGPVVDDDPKKNPNDPENILDRRPTVRCV